MSLIFDQYANRLARKSKSRYTLSNFATVSSRLSRWLDAQGIPAEEASFELLEEYFDTLDLAPSSKGTHLRYVQAAYNYAVRRGTLRHNPALDIEIEEPADKEPRIISARCLRVIRERVLHDRDWLFFHLLAYTGMRRGEIRGLRWDDGDEAGSVVRLAEQTIRVVGKGGKLRLVPIHPALGEALAEAGGEPGRNVLTTTGGPLAEETIQDAVKRLSPTFTPHDYRRTVATSLARNGVPERVIDRIMGWAPRDVRGRYYVNVAPEELHRGILKLYADDPL